MAAASSLSFLSDFSSFSSSAFSSVFSSLSSSVFSSVSSGSSAFSASSLAASSSSTLVPSLTLTGASSRTSSLAASSVASSSDGMVGAVWRFLVTGILAVAASLTIEGSVVTKTTCLFLAELALVINLIFTTLLNTPLFFGGTRATIFSLADSSFEMIFVISSSGSI